MKTRSAQRRRRGFTLIEVMVATGILLIIVMMVGGLFTQASSVWDAGYVRAEGGMVARAIVGAIQRDLQTAVDGRAFDGLGFGTKPLVSESGTIKFVSMKTPDATVGAAGDASKKDRGLHLITYTLAKGRVTRRDEAIIPNGRDGATGRTKWKLDSSKSASEKTSVIYGGSDGSEGAVGADEVSAANSSSFRIDDIGLVYGKPKDGSSELRVSNLRKSFEKSTSQKDHDDFEDYVAWSGTSGMPDWCRVRVVVVSQGSKTGLEVRSAGGGKGGDIVAR